jgi:hypothetical protein
VNNKNVEEMYDESDVMNKALKLMDGQINI